MILPVLFLAMQTAAAPPPEEKAPDDIVITATRDSCRVKFADKDMTDAEFDRRAEDWKAGTPVRVTARADVDFACARKIAMKLFARGAMKVIFVDPTGKPALPFDPPKTQSKYEAPVAPPIAGLAGGSGTGASGGTGSGNYFETRVREHNFISRTASQLILQGKCDEARDMALREGDLDAAAAVVSICQSRKAP